MYLARRLRAAVRDGEHEICICRQDRSKSLRDNPHAEASHPDNFSFFKFALSEEHLSSFVSLLIKPTYLQHCTFMATNWVHEIYMKDHNNFPLARRRNFR